MSDPVISVLTPFHNTAPYLAQCIESVLAQTFTQFEYLLVDNCSTDGSGEIAERYAQRDPRIRLIRRTELLPQVANYNAALTEISPASLYCKIVQADDSIFPDCLSLMVQAFEQSERIGLVSSYDLKGTVVRGSGYPFPMPVISGREMARRYLRDPVWVFGSASTVMYRASLVRECQPFYEEARLHEDTEKCMQILEHWDFGFVHQVLTFIRTDNESISNRVRTYQPHAIDRYIIVQRYASEFLDAEEAGALRRSAKRIYYRILAEEALGFRDSAFWEYHQRGLKTVGQTLDRPYLWRQIVREALRLLGSPGIAVSYLARLLGRSLSPPNASHPGKSPGTRATGRPSVNTSEAAAAATKR